MPTEGNVFYYGYSEIGAHNGKFVHVVRVDERTFKVVADTIDAAIQIAVAASRQ